MSLWALAFLLVLISLLFILIVVVLRYAWIHFLVSPGWPTRARLAENCKFGLLWLAIGALSVLIWLQATCLFPLDVRSAVMNGVVWGSVLTVVVSVASSVRARKVHRGVGWVREGPKKGRRWAWLLLGVLLLGTWIPLFTTYGSYGYALPTPTQILDRQLDFSVVIRDTPLVSSWTFSVLCRYSDFRTEAPWDDDIRVDIEVRNSSGDLIFVGQLDLSIIHAGFWMIVPIPATQYNSQRIPVPAPGLFLFNLTSTFDKPIHTTVIQAGQPLSNLLFIIAAVGTTLFVIGACHLRRRDRFDLSVFEGRLPSTTRPPITA